MSGKYVYQSSIWKEEPEADNPFAARVSYCRGYDVYGDVLKKASWFEYLYLMFKGERPTAVQAVLLEKLAIALANPGPREASVRAAMNSGVAGSRNAASLMAALAVGAGQYGGGHEVFITVNAWEVLGTGLEAWKQFLANPNEGYEEDIWLPIEHAPGFDPNGESCPLPLRQTLEFLAETSSGNALPWLLAQREVLEAHVGYPLAMSGIAAAAFHDLGLGSHQASMLFQMLRLPGAAVHALEQRELGWKTFPYYGEAITLKNDPGSREAPDVSEFNL